MLGFVVPTVGRWSAVRDLLSSLEDASTSLDTEFEVVLVVQGADETIDDEPGRFSGLRVTTVRDTGWGASRARNVGLERLSSDVTHVVWPNDHSVYPPSSLAVLAEQATQAQVVVGRLVENGVDRYTVTGSRAPIDQSNVWDAIEPVTAIATSLVREAGGWSESLGTGAPSPWQSSALADLLLRLPAETSVRWEPGFVCAGSGFTRGASGGELQAKARTYGRGYGRVLSSWNYPWRRRLGSIVKPLVQPGYSVGADVLPLRARVSAALGRAEGVSGHLAPRAKVSPRRRSDIAKH